MNNPNLLSSKLDQKQAPKSREIDGGMGFGEALDALADYAASDLRDDSVLMDYIAEARSGEPDALAAVIVTVQEERSRLGGGDSEASEMVLQTLDSLSRIQSALEKHQLDVQDSANRAEQLDYMKALHEKQRPGRIGEARKDAHEAIDRQPPPEPVFNKTASDLAKKFGTNTNELLKGVSYDDMFQQQPELVRAVHNLNTEYLESPDNSQEMLGRYRKDLEARVGGLQGNARSNNIAPGSSGSRELRLAA
jgi:hypothetical protein